jgi:hypothetical protein
MQKRDKARNDLLGYVIFDMHDYSGRLTYRIHGVEWKIVKDSWQAVDMQGGSAIIENYTGERYTNKYVVVIDDYNHDLIRAAYSYDDRRFGVMTLRPVEHL